MDIRCAAVYLKNANRLGFGISVPVKDIAEIDYNKRIAVILCKDGTVKAYGLSSAYRVDDWTDVVQVACGREHIVALQKDGTVLACGDNSFGQCDVTDLQDVQQIDCGNWTTVALKNDGTVVCRGYSTAHGTSRSSDTWTDVVKITCCSDAYLALKKDGTLYACDTVAAMSMNMNGGHLKVNQWTDIVDISSGYRHCAAVCKDGTVLTAYGDFPWARQQFGMIYDAVSVGCVGDYYAIGHRDGSFSFHGQPLCPRSGKQLSEILDTVVQKRFPGILWGACKLDFSCFEGMYRTAVQFLIPSTEQLTLEGYREAHYHRVQEITYGYSDEFLQELSHDLILEGVDFFLCPMGTGAVRPPATNSYSAKWAAAHAGLGWIGKNGLLITPQYGPRLTTQAILVNDDVPYGTPILVSRCGDCTACVDNCLFHALKGHTWNPESSRREDFIDRNTCYGNRKKAVNSIGRSLACGKCIVSCPYGVTKH